SLPVDVWYRASKQFREDKFFQKGESDRGTSYIAGAKIRRTAQIIRIRHRNESDVAIWDFQNERRVTGPEPVVPNQSRAFVVLCKPSETVWKLFALCGNHRRERQLLRFFGHETVLVDGDIVPGHVEHR